MSQQEKNHDCYIKLAINLTEKGFTYEAFKKFTDNMNVELINSSICKEVVSNEQI